MANLYRDIFIDKGDDFSEIIELTIPFDEYDFTAFVRSSVNSLVGIPIDCVAVDGDNMKMTLFMPSELTKTLSRRRGVYSIVAVNKVTDERVTERQGAAHYSQAAPFIEPTPPPPNYVVSLENIEGAGSAAAADIEDFATAAQGLLADTAVQPEDLAIYAPLASPALTGVPTAPTPVVGTNTAQLATTAFVQAGLDGIVAGAPSTLNTLNELAAAIGDDPNFSTNVENELTLKASQSSLDSAIQTVNLTKAPLASPALTGVPTAPTAIASTNSNQIATTAFVQTLINSLVDAAPGTLNTLNELAAALGDDPNFAATITAAIADKASQTSLDAVASDINTLVSSVDAAEQNINTLVTEVETKASQSSVDALAATVATKAPLASPALTGVPTAPTAVASTNTTQIATTAFVQAVVSALVDAAPGTLNTLNELAAALGDDPNFATTITNSIAAKASQSTVDALTSSVASKAEADLSNVTAASGREHFDVLPEAFGFYEDFGRYPDNTVFRNMLATPLIGNPWRVNYETTGGGVAPSVTAKGFGDTNSRLWYIGSSVNTEGGRFSMGCEYSLPFTGVTSGSGGVVLNMSFAPRAMMIDYVPIAFSAVGSTNVCSTASPHGLVVGSNGIVYGTNIPSGLTAGVTYYVVAIPSANSFQLSATLGGAVIDIGDSTGADCFFSSMGISPQGVMHVNIAPGNVAQINYYPTQFVSNDITDTATIVGGHDMATGDKLLTSGTLPTGLSIGTYYAIVIDAENFKFASSLSNALAGIAIPIGTSTLATQSFVMIDDVVCLNRAGAQNFHPTLASCIPATGSRVRYLFEVDGEYLHITLSGFGTITYHSKALPRKVGTTTHFWFESNGNTSGTQVQYGKLHTAWANAPSLNRQFIYKGTDPAIFQPLSASILDNATSGNPGVLKLTGRSGSKLKGDGYSNGVKAYIAGSTTKAYNDTTVAKGGNIEIEGGYLANVAGSSVGSSVTGRAVMSVNTLITAPVTTATVGRVFTAVGSTNVCSTVAAHGFTASTSVVVTGANLPSGLTSGNRYFIVTPTSTTFQLALTQFGAVIDIGDSTGADCIVTPDVNIASIHRNNTLEPGDRQITEILGNLSVGNKTIKISIAFQPGTIIFDSGLITHTGPYKIRLHKKALTGFIETTYVEFIVNGTVVSFTRAQNNLTNYWPYEFYVGQSNASSINIEDIRVNVEKVVVLAD